MKAIRSTVACILAFVILAGHEHGFAEDRNIRIEPLIVKQEVEGSDLEIINFGERETVEIVPKGLIRLKVPQEIEDAIVEFTGRKSPFTKETISIGTFDIEHLHLSVLANDRYWTVNNRTQGHEIKHQKIHEQKSGKVAFFSSKILVNDWDGLADNLASKHYYLKLDVLVTKIGEFKRKNGVVDEQFSATAIWHGPIVESKSKENASD